MTQERIEEQIAELTKNLNIIKVLREFGVTKNDAEKFIDNIPTISSGYSMGEYVSISFATKDTRCGIFSYGNYSTYAKSCKWKPTYGAVRVSLKTKKALRKLYLISMKKPKPPKTKSMKRGAINCLICKTPNSNI